MTTITTARQSQTNWMNAHLKCCSRLNKSFHTILVGVSFIASLICYSKVWNKFLKQINAFNCEIGGNRVQYLL